MVEIIQTDFQVKKRERDECIVKTFRGLKGLHPDAKNSECIRGIATTLSISTNIVRRALKDSSLI